jgi:hypothetical protein
MQQKRRVGEIGLDVMAYLSRQSADCLANKDTEQWGYCRFKNRVWLNFYYANHDKNLFSIGKYSH